MRARLAGLGRPKFVRDTLAAQGTGIVQAGTYLATSILIARALGPHETGRWSAALEIALLVTYVCSAGLETAAVSRYAEVVVRDDERGKVEVLAGLLKLGGLLAVLVAVLVACFGPDFAEASYGDRAVGQAAAWLGLTAAIELWRTLAVAALTGARRWAAFARFDIAANLLRLGLVVVAVVVFGTLEALVVAALAHAVVSASLGLLAYGSARRDGGPFAPPALREVFAAVPRAPIGRFFGLTWMLAVNKTVHRTVTRLGMVVIPGLAVLMVDGQGMAEGAAYKVAFVLNLVLQNAVGAIASVFLSTLGHKLDEAPLSEQGGLLRRVSLTAGCLSIAATLASVPLAWLAIRYGYGEGFEGAFEPFLLLAVANLFLGFGVIVGPFYIYADRLRASVIQNIVYAGLVLAAMAWAVPRYGPLGVAGAVGFGHALLLGHLVYVALWYRRQRVSSGGDTRHG